MELTLTMLKKISLSAFVLLLFAAVLHDDDKNIVDDIIARVGNSIITRYDSERGKQLSQEDLKQRSPSDWQSKWTVRCSTARSKATASLFFSAREMSEPKF